MRMPFLPFLPFLALALAAGALLPGARCSSYPQPTPDPHVSEDRLIRRVVALTNAARARQKLRPLKLADDLCAAAGWMARDMADHDYLGHIDHQTRNIDARLPAFGYADYLALGENVAGGQTTPDTVIADWLGSADHRANVLDPQLREIGAAHAVGRGTRYMHFWVEDFGAREKVYPVVVNDESGETHSDSVHLTIYGDGWATKMRLSGDGSRWTPWEPYRADRDWSLGPGTGRRTVYVELSDGMSTVQSRDTVEVTPEPAAQVASRPPARARPARRRPGR